MSNYPEGAERALHEIQDFEARVEVRKQTLKQALRNDYKEAIKMGRKIRTQSHDGTFCLFSPQEELLEYLPAGQLVLAMQFWASGEKLRFAVEIDECLDYALEAMIEAHAQAAAERGELDDE